MTETTKEQGQRWSRGRDTSYDVSQELSRNLGDLTIDWSLVFQLTKLGRLESVWSLSKGEIENGE